MALQKLSDHLKIPSPAAFKRSPLDKGEEFMLFFDGKHIELFLLTVV